jgi:hypothetical protein
LRLLFFAPLREILLLVQELFHSFLRSGLRSFARCAGYDAEGVTRKGPGNRGSGPGGRDSGLGTSCRLSVVSYQLTALLFLTTETDN